MSKRVTFLKPAIGWIPTLLSYSPTIDVCAYISDFHTRAFFCKMAIATNKLPKSLLDLKRFNIRSFYTELDTTVSPRISSIFEVPVLTHEPM